MFIRLVIILLLTVIVIQDLCDRAVIWLIFPALTLCFISAQFLKDVPLTEVIHKTILNSTFLLVVLALVWGYICLKYRKLVYLPDQFLGWGDIFLLFSICFYLSFLNFIFFYIVSLTAVLFFWLIYIILRKNQSEEIPLAGLQSAVLIVFLVCDWYLDMISVTSDDWLLSRLIR